uniref:Cytochrome P450 n=1 Tax=Leersia perrieri TaxID=77586 RepID=A0A0D9VHC5_9ORYZ
MEKSELSSLWMLAAAALAAVLLYLSTLRRRYVGGKPLPPGPMPLPLIGNLHCLGGTFHHTLAKLARAHGPVMTLRLGLPTAVIISSRDAAAEAYTKYDQRLAARPVPDAFRANHFSDRSMTFTPSSDPQWKSQRSIFATNIFSPRGLAELRAIRERKVRELVGYIRARAGEEMHVREVVHNGVLNLMSSSFFSVDMADVGSASAHGLRQLIEDIVAKVSSPNVSDFVPILGRLDLQGLRRKTGKLLDNAFGILDDIIEHRLDESRDNPAGKHGDFLDALLKLLSDGKIPRFYVTHMLFDVFVAGADTMTTTIEWAMAELIHNPRVMAKVQAEMKDVLGSKETIDEADVARLTYLHCVFKEAMRLHPVGCILVPHLAVQDGVEIGGYAIPKGTTVIFNAWAIMRDPTAWEEPDKFVPERFLQKSSPLDLRGKEAEFIPFGSGRRLCPGLSLADRVVPLILASLLHAFEWRLPDGMSAEKMDMTERFTTINVLATSLKAVPVVKH